jgi:hypothetical protein
MAMVSATDSIVKNHTPDGFPFSFAPIGSPPVPSQVMVIAIGSLVVLSWLISGLVFYVRTNDRPDPSSEGAPDLTIPLLSNST